MRIKITGYIDTDEMDPAHLDLAHETGLSEDGYIAVTTGQMDLGGMEDIETELVD